MVESCLFLFFSPLIYYLPTLFYHTCRETPFFCTPVYVRGMSGFLFSFVMRSSAIL